MGELTSKRTPCSKTYRMADGRMRAEIYTAPVHYQDAAGKWQNIVTTWETEDGFGRKVKKAGAHLRIHGEGGILRVGFAPGAYIDYTLPGSLIVDGSIASLSDAWEKADLRYTATPRGVKGEIILREAGHPEAFVFPAALTGCIALEEGDGLGIYADEDQIGVIPAPYAIDANGSRGPVALAWDGKSIALTPDPDWLASAAYPVMVDPTTTLMPVSGAGIDTYISVAFPDTNYGTQTNLDTRSGSNALVKFDLSTIPAASNIISAVLSLFQGPGATTTDNILAHRVTADWLEAQATWNSRVTGTAWATAGGDYYATPAATTSVGTDTGYYAWDVATLVQEWLDSTYANYGVLFKGSANLHDFYSSDYVAFPDMQPKLVIEYNEKPTATLTWPSGSSGTPTGANDDLSPTIAWTYADPESDAQTKLQVRVWDESSNLVYDSGEVASAVASHTIPLTAGLVYGETYQVKARVRDGTGWSVYSAAAYMLFTLTAPANLAAADDATGAEMDLTWDAHAGENLAGYNVYRRTGSAAYAQVNTALATTNAYSDRLAVSGVAYDYQVTAVASDGYESAKSSSASDTVTYTKFMIDAVEVFPPLSAIPKFDRPRRASRRVATDGSYIIQDLGLLPRIGVFYFQFSSKASRDAILAVLTADHTFSYRGPDGETFAGKVVSEISEDRYKMPPSSGFYGILSFEAAEVLP